MCHWCIISIKVWKSSIIWLAEPFKMAARRFKWRVAVLNGGLPFKMADGVKMACDTYSITRWLAEPPHVNLSLLSAGPCLLNSKKSI